VQKHKFGEADSTGGYVPELNNHILLTSPFGILQQIEFTALTFTVLVKLQLLHYCRECAASSPQSTVITLCIMRMPLQFCFSWKIQLLGKHRLEARSLLLV